VTLGGRVGVVGGGIKALRRGTALETQFAVKARAPSEAACPPAISRPPTVTIPLDPQDELATLE
jgi:hypothetical protein